MAIMYPSAAVARRWNGALQARLRRAPLEEFLRARAITPATAGLSQHSDDVARATHFIIESGIAFYSGYRDDGLDADQRGIVGQVACVVSRALADLIGEPAIWRISALVSATRLLTPWVGLNAAALLSASAVRQYRRDIGKPVRQMDLRIARTTTAALSSGTSQPMAEISARIAMRLSFPMARSPNLSADAPVRVNASP